MRAFRFWEDDTIRWPRLWGWLFAIGISTASWCALAYLLLFIP